MMCHLIEVLSYFRLSFAHPSSWIFLKMGTLMRDARVDILSNIKNEVMNKKSVAVRRLDVISLSCISYYIVMFMNYHIVIAFVQKCGSLLKVNKILCV